MKVLYAGSFNPFHLAHQYVYDTACKCFGKENVWIGIGQNKDKPIKNLNKIKYSLVPITPNVITYTGLTAKVIREHGFDLLVRGIRPGKSIEQEEDLLYWNRNLTGIDTILIPTHSDLCRISSSAIRELAADGEYIYDYVNPEVYMRLNSLGTDITRVYFGKSCSGKSTYLDKIGACRVNMDLYIWELIKLPESRKNILKEQLRGCVRNPEQTGIYNSIIYEIARNIDWLKFTQSGRNIDAAVIGVYWDYIPPDIRGLMNLVKVETSEANRRKFAEMRNVSKEFLYFSDCFYKDPPYWDETITIEEI